LTQGINDQGVGIGKGLWQRVGLIAMPKSQYTPEFAESCINLCEPLQKGVAYFRPFDSTANNSLFFLDDVSHDDNVNDIFVRLRKISKTHENSIAIFFSLRSPAWSSPRKNKQQMEMMFQGESKRLYRAIIGPSFHW